MDVRTLSVDVFGAGSFVLALPKYTLDRRKVKDTESNMKNPNLLGTA